jgi:hypothetical protein
MACHAVVIPTRMWNIVPINATTLARVHRWSSP